MEDLGELSMWHAPSINDAYEKGRGKKMPQIMYTSFMDGP